MNTNKPKYQENKMDAIHNLLLKKWEEAISRNEFEIAINLDIYHYNNLVKKNEDIYFWNKWQTETLPTRIKLQDKFCQNQKFHNTKSNNNHKLAIVYHNYSGLAHESQLLRNINFLIEKNYEIQFDIIYLFGYNKNSLSNARELYKSSAKSIYFLSATSYIEAGIKINDLIKTGGYHSILYPSIYWLAYWMSLFVEHNNQKFLQMKYFPKHAGRIKYWAGGQYVEGEKYHINGYSFDQLPILKLKQAEDIKFDSPSCIDNIIYFGSISRPEKISNKEYNNLILKLLNEVPNSIYLYTGRKDGITIIPNTIIHNDRAKYLGWINPVDKISNFSIYLEPFPWGGGDMTLLALEAGRPYLTLETEENKLFGIYSFLKLLLNNNDPILEFSFCKSLSELNNRFLILSKDREFRIKLGMAWRLAILNYKPNGIERWLNFLLNK